MAKALPPQQLSVSFPSATTALLKWAGAADAADLIEYQVNVAEGASVGTTGRATGSTRQHFLVVNLKRGRQYTFQVQGINDSGPGTGSKPLTARTPIASLNNTLFFKACRHYASDAEPDPTRVNEHGNASNIIREVSDNDYRTFSKQTDYVVDISNGGKPTRVDAFFVKGQRIRQHSGTPTGGSGTGWKNVDVPDTVVNWEGANVATTVAGFQHHLFLLPKHFTATSVRLQFQGTDIEITEFMLLEFGLEIDANSDFTQINTDFVDREGILHPIPGGGVAHGSPLGYQRDKWEVEYVVRIVPGKTILKTPEEFLYWRAENRNHVFAMEPSRFPWRIFPATFLRNRTPIRYRTDDKIAGEVITLQIAEQ